MRIGAFLMTVSVTLFVIGLKSQADTFEGVLRPQVDRGCEGEAQRPIKGWASYGTLGPSCLAVNQGDALRASLLYPDFTIDWKKIVVTKEGGKDSINDEGHAHISQYAVNVLNLIDQMASDFLKNRVSLERDLRKHDLSSEELGYWQLFSEIVGYQESLFSQYQRDDNDKDNVSRLRITVGDPLFIRGSNGLVFHDTKGNPEQARDKYGRPIYQSKGMFQLLASLNSLFAKNNFDLVLNIENGQEYLYRDWARILGYAPMEKWLANAFSQCRSQIFTSHGVNYLNVLRAAYGMYNGGDEKICRFAESDKYYAQYRKENPMCEVGQVAFSSVSEKDRCESRQKNGYFAYPWVNDVRIMQLSKDLRWEKALGIKRDEREHMRDENPNWLSFDLNCARQNGRFCLRAKDSKSRLNALLSNDLEGKLYTLNRDDSHVGNEGSFCAYTPATKNFTCTHQEKWVSCLRTGQKFPIEKTEVNHKLLAAYFTLYTLPLEENDPLIHFVDDPRKLCSQNDNGIFVTGDYVRVMRNMIVRKEANAKSAPLTTLNKDSVFQVLDFDLNPKLGLERWYKIETQNKHGQTVDGYIFGGDDLSWSSLLAKFTGTPHINEIVIPHQGDQIQFTNPDFASMMTTPSIIQDISIGGADQTVSAEILNDQNKPSWVRLGQLRTNAGSVGESFNSQFKVLSTPSFDGAK
jgi:hypothetical protein